MNGAELLNDAGRRVATGWCQGADARSDRGEEVDVRSDEATSWSLLGALQAAAFGDGGTAIGDIAVAVAALAELINDPSLAAWNDRGERTQREVHTLLEEAEGIARAEVGAPR